MTCLRPLALPGVRACGARGEPSAVLPSRPREQLTRHDREDKVRALAAAAALVAWLGSAYPSALRAVCGHVCSSALVYVRVERSGEACREAPPPGWISDGQTVLVHHVCPRTAGPML